MWARRLLCGLFALGLSASASQAEFLKLDFLQGTETPATGFVAMHGIQETNSPVITSTDIAGTDYDFSITNVATWSSGPQSLTRSGFYTFGNDSLAHAFTLSGLELGAEVTMYAMAAWDGNGRGALIHFGGFDVQAETLNEPITELTLTGNYLQHFKKINATPLIATTGSVSGTFGGPTLLSEGQIGAVVFEVNSVPEPSTAALILLGAGAFATRRRLRKNV